MEPHAFARTGSVDLQPVDAGRLVYLEAGTGVPEAVVHVQRVLGESKMEAVLAGESTRHLFERHLCTDLDDVPVFYLDRYRATDDPSFTVFDPDGEPLATYFADGRDVEVRDGTGAPVATMREQHHRFDIIETGGRTLAFCWRDDTLVGEVVDHTWRLAILEAPRLLDRRAVVAAPLVCRLRDASCGHRRRTASSRLL